MSRDPVEVFDEWQAMRKELAEWRSGRRRVFWRTRSAKGIVADFVKKGDAVYDHALFFPASTLFRVTVRPKVKP